MWIEHWRLEGQRKQSNIKIKIQRVNQLDAAQLDEEVLSLLWSQLEQVFRFLPPGILVSLKPELQALLKFIYFAQFTGTNTPTPGQTLQNLQYRDERAFDSFHWTNLLRSIFHYPINIKDTCYGTEIVGLSTKQRFVFGFLYVIVPWIYTRLDTSGILRRWLSFAPIHISLLSRCCYLGERVYRIACLVNFILFLYDGTYVSLVERIVGARLVYRDLSATRMVSFEFLNRQLVWEEFTELLLFLWPLFSSNVVKQLFRDIIGKRLLHRETRQDIPADACPICRCVPPKMPHLARPCGHAYCYYCLSWAMQSFGYCCERCGDTVRGISRVGPVAHTSPTLVHAKLQSS
ncbi:peroxisomal membrane protein peroxin-2 isoform 1 [Galdieria sulphuraria]|uniref:RING-type E3 ubiquitin transferase (cysteine targeting) n=1 Tax=Galdieria sulphuraria TaxID=130081 RepID=M2XGA5_GALSU|nr:peroxisomal membrane protein peroxin-2 isoform 1 [Galdieria sulphuraria]EME29077.1 peroxisomal membrane protein peroxin-2 isoform 1 [Galdieria sulphuraria]|eukprot:XP_005705597.1 peroxisomal membrane protein peroxin-2 isoform 1 [Galdieria sulphuraria]